MTPASPPLGRSWAGPLWVAYAAAALGFYLAAFSRLSLVVVVPWFGAFFVWRLLGLEGRLPEPERRLYLWTVAAYPLLEGGLKWMIERNVIPYSWFSLNRLEHLAGSAATMVLLLPAYAAARRRLGPWHGVLLVVGLACLVGNLNEFLEYGLRLRSGIRLVHYGDTILDMAVNVVGGLLAGATLRRVGGAGPTGS